MTYGEECFDRLPAGLVIRIEVLAKRLERDLPSPPIWLRQHAGAVRNAGQVSTRQSQKWNGRRT